MPAVLNPQIVPTAQSSAPDQKDLIRRAQGGDQQAFAEIYRLYRRRVFSLCLRMVHKPEDAEDLTQEAFLQLFRKLHTFRGDSAFSTWLHRVVVNVVLMSLRKKSSRETSIEELGPEESDNPPAVLRCHDGRLEHSLDRVALERAQHHLPPGYRLAFALHDVLGYEHAETAEILGCSAGNCKSQLHKARMKLRKILCDEAASHNFGRAA